MILRNRTVEVESMSEVQKVVLAYSGGLDTSVIIPWLKENYGCEVIAFVADVGQGPGELDGIEEKALKSGASKCIVADLREEFLTEYVWPTLRAGAVYEGKYLLGTSMARPPIARRQMEIAHAEGAQAVAHGCTGKGNDQVRFELTFKALDPAMRIIAPWRDWSIKSRDEEIDYALAHGIPVPVTKEKNYSMDRNLWHISYEGGILEEPWNEPDEDMFLIGTSPENAPDSPVYVVVSFEQGTPVAVDGEALDPIALLEKLNELGAMHGVGRCDIVENRLVGMKSRGVYETPGGTILMTAHKELEYLCLDRDTMHYKQIIAERYAEIVYNGQWFTPLREALDAFVNTTQTNVTGDVRLKLYKGNCIVVGRRSPYSLYDPELATFGADQVYDQAWSRGFINLLGLPVSVQAALRNKQGKSLIRPYKEG